MTKEEFINKLKESNISQSDKVGCIRFFLKNYPVFISNKKVEVAPGMFMEQQGISWTGLDIDLSNLKYTPKMDEAIKSLQGRTKELEEFNN